MTEIGVSEKGDPLTDVGAYLNQMGEAGNFGRTLAITNILTALREGSISRMEAAEKIAEVRFHSGEDFLGSIYEI